MYTFMELVVREARLKLIKTIYHLIRLLIGSLKICFVSVVLTKSELHAIVYNAVNVTKIPFIPFYPTSSNFIIAIINHVHTYFYAKKAGY